jgi:HEAT repeat protein
LATKTIRIKYRTVNRFLHDYAQLRNGRIALPAVSHVPANTSMSLKIFAPGVGPVLAVRGAVVKTFDVPGAGHLKKPVTMLIGFNGGSQDAIRHFNEILSNFDQYRVPLGLAVPRGKNGPMPSRHAAVVKPAAGKPKRASLSMEWIRAALARRPSLPNQKTAALNPAATAKITQDVQTNTRTYVKRILRVDNTEDAVVLLRLFRLILPALIGQADWGTVRQLIRAVEKAARATVFFAAVADLPANPLEFVFKNHTDAIAAAHVKANAAQRTMIAEIAVSLETLGIDIMAKALSSCRDRRVGKTIMTALLKNGALARNWILAVLDAPGQKWYLKCTALRLLKYVGRKEDEMDRARKLVHHEHPRVRQEALNVLITLKSFGARDLVIAALDDVDEKVRWRAMTGLGELAPISEGSIKNLLARITAAAPEDKEQADRHHRKVARLIRALGAIPDIAGCAAVEETILDIVRGRSNQKKGFFKRLRKSRSADQPLVLAAAVKTLGHIGTTRSEPFLEKLAGSQSPQAESARRAANNIKLRYIAMLSNAPVDTGIAAGWKPTRQPDHSVLPNFLA